MVSATQNVRFNSLLGSNLVFELETQLSAAAAEAWHLLQAQVIRKPSSVECWFTQWQFFCFGFFFFYSCYILTLSRMVLQGCQKQILSLYAAFCRAFQYSKSLKCFFSMCLLISVVLVFITVKALVYQC